MLRILAILTLRLILVKLFLQTITESDEPYIPTFRGVVVVGGEEFERLTAFRSEALNGCGFYGDVHITPEFNGLKRERLETRSASESSILVEQVGIIECV